MEEGGHVIVQGGHHLGLPLDDGHLDPHLRQILRQFQADEAAPRQHGGAGLLPLHKGPDGQGVLHGAEGEKALAVQPRNLRPGGVGPGGQEEFVILLGGDRPGLQVLYRDGLGRRVDGGGLVAHPGIDAEPLPEPLGGLEGERLLILDHPADVIGQAAVGVGDEAGALQHHDLRLLVQPADPGRRRGPAGHPANDDNFHAVVPPSVRPR